MPSCATSLRRGIFFVSPPKSFLRRGFVFSSTGVHPHSVSPQSCDLKRAHTNKGHTISTLYPEKGVHKTVNTLFPCKTLVCVPKTPKGFHHFRCSSTTGVWPKGSPFKGILPRTPQSAKVLWGEPPKLGNWEPELKGPGWKTLIPIRNNLAYRKYRKEKLFLTYQLKVAQWKIPI